MVGCHKLGWLGVGNSPMIVRTGSLAAILLSVTGLYAQSATYAYKG